MFRSRILLCFDGASLTSVTRTSFLSRVSGVTRNVRYLVIFHIGNPCEL